MGSWPRTSAPGALFGLAVADLQSNWGVMWSRINRAAEEFYSRLLQWVVALAVASGARTALLPGHLVDPAPFLLPLHRNKRPIASQWRLCYRLRAAFLGSGSWRKVGWLSVPVWGWLCGGLPVVLYRRKQLYVINRGGRWQVFQETSYSLW